MYTENIPYPADWSISLVVYLWKSWNWLSTGGGFLSSLPADLSLRPWWRYFDHQVHGHYGIISQTSHKNTDFSLFWQGYSMKNAFLKGRRKKIICSITFFKSLLRSFTAILEITRNQNTDMSANYYYMSVNCTSLLKIKPSWKSVVFTIKVRKNSLYFAGVFNTTIIPLVLVGYEMIIANSVLRALFTIYHLISNTHTWNNC